MKKKKKEKIYLNFRRNILKNNLNFQIQFETKREKICLDEKEKLLIIWIKQF